ncbi:MAG TPA: hypothetical protein VFQ61_14675 [Polyangiaceae bacterium]|nr:hypothetical protein [Polyangiaceae bacterium]
MKNTTRREILGKLGASAAALTTLSVAGVAAAQAQVAKVAPTKAILATEARTRVKLAPGDATVQINVGIDRKGFILQTQRLTGAEPKVGLTAEGKVLQLGLKIKDGVVDVIGLDSVLNRPGNVAAEGRCTMRNLSQDAVVLPGVDLLKNTKALAKF